MNELEFIGFPKIPRLNREIVITEKLDGTNAAVCITASGEIFAGSRNRWITPGDDNYGFARWVEGNKEELLKLGMGRHYGEWWGQGIQRNYGLKEKKFSLFNAVRWFDWVTPPTDACYSDDHSTAAPKCCRVVPVLYRGPFNPHTIQGWVDELRITGSRAAIGFYQPEGIVVYHTAAKTAFKVTLEDDESPKGSSCKPCRSERAQTI